MNQYPFITDEILNDYHLNDAEKAFFNELLKQAQDFPGQFRLMELGNGSFNVDYDGDFYLGKIDLKNAPFYMQYFKGTTCKELKGVSLEECIETIPKWLAYIKYCQKTY